MKAVILAGGIGERLKPLTNAIPKALACVNGTPIIQQQIEILKRLDIKHFIILTGYRSDMIKKYLSSVNTTDEIKIEIIETPVEFSPAQRILSASNQIGQDFILVYCDNLIHDESALRNVIDSTKQITFLAEFREVGNLAIHPRTRYFLERSSENPFVELGYLHVKTEQFYEVLNSVKTLQGALVALSSDIDCETEICESSLTSVSNISRFNKSRSKRKTILLDRDGILNEKMPHRMYLNNFNDYAPLEDNLKTLRESYSEDTDFIIITNQPGIATGEVDSEFLDQLHSSLITELLIMGISVIGIYVCTHHWDENCLCRKPKPGMILQSISDYELDTNKIVYIGDELKDIEAATNAGIAGIRLTDQPNFGEFHSFIDAYESIQAIISM